MSEQPKNAHNAGSGGDFASEYLRSEFERLKTENATLRRMPYMEYSQRILETAKLVEDQAPDFIAQKPHNTTDAMPVPDCFVEPFNELTRVIRQFDRSPNRQNSSEVLFRATELFSAMKGLFYWPPAAAWRVLKESDPHVSYYERQRKELTLGSFTDDALANHNFMSPSVVSLTAAKERIRFLSRISSDLKKENDELKAKLAKYEGATNES